jgi:surface antigen
MRTNQPDSFSYSFIIEDSADLYALTGSISDKLASVIAQVTDEELEVILMLGFNDCINCCTWEQLPCKQVATQYSTAINNLILQYPNINFYFCSINPVDGDFLGTGNGYMPIDQHTLNYCITVFNNIIKNSNATYIDSYGYLLNTSFNTRDGIVYSNNTCINLLSYILNNLNKTRNIPFFLPRMEAPDVEDFEIGNFWVSSTTPGGLNPFLSTADSGQYAKSDYDTLPNSTAYAWGRFYEILGTQPTLSTERAECWFLNTADGYLRGSSPMVGAIACWEAGSSTSSTDGGGHVAIVEKVNSDGSIVTSESMLNDSKYWWTTVRVKGNDNNWGMSSNYKFQGFIYCPDTINNDTTAKQPFTLNTLKVDFVTPTSAKFSFIARNGSTFKYFLKKFSNSSVTSSTLTVPYVENKLLTHTFDCNNLEPSTFYSLTVEASANAAAASIRKTIFFSTPQALPKTISEIKLKPVNTILPYTEFKLDVEPLHEIDWGYWRVNSHGYVMQLIINGNVFEEKTVESIDPYKVFNIKELFTAYTPIIGDCIQIGIRTWVTDSAGTRLFDSNQYSRCSNSVCIMPNKLNIYLNKL